MLSNMEISSFCQELSLLLHSGVSVGDGLALLAETAETKQQMLHKMKDGADEGRLLSSLVRDTGMFPLHVSALIEVGEQSGKLEESLHSLATYYDDRDRMDKQILSSLLYPSVLLMLMLVVIVVLLVRVLPVFRDVYVSLGGQLTGLAGGLFRAGQFLGSIMPVLCVALALVAVFLCAFTSSYRFRTYLTSFWHKKRGDRGVSRKMSDARFAQALAMGLHSGLPIEDSLDLAALLLGDFPPAVERCKECREKIADGSGLAEALRDADVLPATSCRLLALGLKSGTGDSVMEEVARKLMRESEDSIEKMVGRIEPTLVLSTSVLVGAILLSVMLPLMNIMAAIG